MEETDSNSNKLDSQIFEAPETDNVSKHLTKAQRRKLKKEKRKEERKLSEVERKRKEIKKKFRNYAIIILIIIAISAFFYWKSIPPKNAPIIEITPDNYNFGSVSQARGITTAEMTISNKGTEPLILNNMDTSCSCTSASIIYKGIESPKFTMATHGTNPKNWQQIIPAGESAQLKIYYNPNVHATMRGPATRSIFVYSNDPRNKQKEVRISLVQTD